MIPGLTGRSEMIVTEKDLVSSLGSVPVDVLSTPRLIQLLEEAAITAIGDLMPPDHLSLGTGINVKHLSPTPPGKKVVAHALLKSVDRNRLHFIVDAYDDIDKVAEGEHVRMLVPTEVFLEKVKKKKGP